MGWVTRGGSRVRCARRARGRRLGARRAKNHAFVDGNKRTAFYAMLVFPEVNGIVLTLPEDEWEPIMQGIANGATSRAELAERIAIEIAPPAPRPRREELLLLANELAWFTGDERSPYSRRPPRASKERPREALLLRIVRAVPETSVATSPDQHEILPEPARSISSPSVTANQRWGRS